MSAAKAKILHIDVSSTELQSYGVIAKLLTLP
jgi:hypothetical protein